MTDRWRERPRHPDDACADLLLRLLPDVPRIEEALGFAGDQRFSTTDLVELFGRALWDIFSDNHTVADAEGTVYDLGSFRGSGGFIAEVLNGRYPDIDRPFTYLDFYMGGALLGTEVDLHPLHRTIFSRLKSMGCDWIYSFPRIHLVDLRDQVTRLAGGLADDPSEAVRAELAEAERKRELERLAARLDAAHEDSVRRARSAPLPGTVAAYRDVYGRLPDGWPHPDT